MRELVNAEVQLPMEMIRTANAAWIKARDAREVFDMEEAEAAFNTAARALSRDWWGEVRHARTGQAHQHFRSMSLLITRLGACSADGLTGLKAGRMRVQVAEGHARALARECKELRNLKQVCYRHS